MDGDRARSRPLPDVFLYFLLLIPAVLLAFGKATLSMVWDAFVLAPDPEALASDFEARGPTLPGGVHERSDGLRGFEVRDPDGHVLFFGHPT